MLNYATSLTPYGNFFVCESMAEKESEYQKNIQFISVVIQ